MKVAMVARTKRMMRETMMMNELVLFTIVILATTLISFGVQELKDNHHGH